MLMHDSTVKHHHELTRESPVICQRIARISAPLSDDSVDTDTIGGRLKEALRLRGRSQNWLEEKAGFSRGHVSRLINGRGEGADPETLGKVAEHLDISLDWLVRGDAPMSRVKATTVERDGTTKKPIRFGDLPGWREADAEARERFDDLPGYAFDRAANTSGGRPPTRIDAHSVAALARFWLESTSRDERRQAEAEEVARGVKEADKAAGRHTPPPPSAGTIKRGK